MQKNIFFSKQKMSFASSLENIEIVPICVFGILVKDIKKMICWSQIYHQTFVIIYKTKN